ncbi:hypothetical protein [Actinomycetospora termitidis]|uniref:Secreted protein n=1 Tax=Actinomycetospora termitidis TaxID=3053470 RepID=A0ABT7M4K5_9PSEU|nr:hypothetical protein [Actinomycetospora sp. Odt1-22]MDL5155585.1 hypothetical protein [Actinomycetospora sp. Odt1-22]
MSVFRKTVLASAILGAGLASTAGVATAHEHHDAGKSCSNAAEAASKNSSGKSLGDTTGGDQDLAASNTCDILNGNQILSDNNAATAGTIVNGDTTDITRTRTSSDTSTTTTAS